MTFRPVASPFGTGVDEQATTAAFEEFVGGVAKAQRLLQLYLNSYPSEGVFGKRYSKTDNFRRRAKLEDIPDEHVEAFLIVTSCT